jgi:hypothetical protein
MSDSLHLTVPREEYSELSRVAVNCGADDVHIVSSTDTEYEVDVVGSGKAIESLQNYLYVTGRSGPTGWWRTKVRA